MRILRGSEPIQQAHKRRRRRPKRHKGRKSSKTLVPARMPDGRIRWYETAASAKQAREAACKAARAKIPHPEQVRAYQRIGRHLDRTTGSFRWNDIRAIYYRQHRRCFYCKAVLGEGPPSRATFHIDHKKPVYHGGTNSPDNLCLACPSCNREKSASPFHTYIEARRRRGLTAPSRDDQFPLFDLPERLAEERQTQARMAAARTARKDPWERPTAIIRRRPGRGQVPLEQRIALQAPSRKAKATGEVATTKAPQ